MVYKKYKTGDGSKMTMCTCIVWAKGNKHSLTLTKRQHFRLVQTQDKLLLKNDSLFDIGRVYNIVGKG